MRLMNTEMRPPTLSEGRVPGGMKVLLVVMVSEHIPLFEEIVLSSSEPVGNPGVRERSTG